MAERPAIVTIENGEKAPGTFSAAEMQRRLEALRWHMAAARIDRVLLTSYHAIDYYADFLYCAFGRPYGLVVTPERATTVSASIDGGQPWRRGAGDNLVYTDWQQDNYLRALQRLVPDGGTLGIEFDHVTLQARARLEAALPGTRLVDISEACMRLRMIKSPEEIALIRQGAAVADVGGAACVEAIGEGVPEYEVALHATRAMVREIARRFPDAELIDTWTWFQSGINTDGAHNPVTSRRIGRGDILSLNCFPMLSGYYTALERTLFYAECPAPSLVLWRANVEVHEAGQALIRPGAVCGEIARALNEVYARHGLLERRSFGYGHSFGVLSHYYGREAGLELREDIETVLEPGMVVSIEPMIMIPDGQPGSGGYREHDILVVTEEGADNITGYPYGPDHNIVEA